MYIYIYIHTTLGLRRRRRCAHEDPAAGAGESRQTGGPKDSGGRTNQLGLSISSPRATFPRGAPSCPGCVPLIGHAPMRDFMSHVTFVRPRIGRVGRSQLRAHPFRLARSLSLSLYIYIYNMIYVCVSLSICMYV